MSLNSGFQNENELESCLNGRKIDELNPNLQAFMLDLFHPTAEERATQVVHARRTADTDYKPDLIIELAGRECNVSVKIGNGNSVHQEPINGFIQYITDVLHATPAEVAALQFFHWGDGTLDGSAPVASRMSASVIKQNYPDKIAIIQNFFDQHRDALLQRFLSTGVTNKSHVDWIYYGDAEAGDWCAIAEAYDHLRVKPHHSPAVGGLNFQTYGRSLEGKDDKRRNSIQLKWTDMPTFFQVGSKAQTRQDSHVSE